MLRYQLKRYCQFSFAAALFICGNGLHAQTGKGRIVDDFSKPLEGMFMGNLPAVINTDAKERVGNRT